jgi:hypothetical protein
MSASMIRNDVEVIPGWSEKSAPSWTRYFAQHYLWLRHRQRLLRSCDNRLKNKPCSQRFHSAFRVAPPRSHEWEHDVGYDRGHNPALVPTGPILPSRSPRDHVRVGPAANLDLPAPLIKRRIAFADSPCVKQRTPGTQDPKSSRADERRVGNGEKVAADPFCLIQVDRSTNDAIHYDRVACLAPAQNFYNERLTITHVPTRSTSSKPSFKASISETAGTSRMHCRGLAIPSLEGANPGDNETNWHTRTGIRHGP